MGFIGGELRESFVERIRQADPGRLLAVSIDVGKHSAAAMVCDFWGEVLTPPFTFELNERGFEDFTGNLARAEAVRGATWVRIGLEQAATTTVPSGPGSRPTASRSHCSTRPRSKRTATRTCCVRSSRTRPISQPWPSC